MSKILPGALGADLEASSLESAGAMQAARGEKSLTVLPSCNLVNYNNDRPGNARVTQISLG